MLAHIYIYIIVVHKNICVTKRKTIVFELCAANLPTKFSHPEDTANLSTKILDLGGVDSGTILIFRGGILMSVGSFPESSSRAILVGRFLVGRLGVFGGNESECSLLKIWATSVQRKDRLISHERYKLACRKTVQIEYSDLISTLNEPR